MSTSLNTFHSSTVSFDGGTFKLVVHASHSKKSYGFKFRPSIVVTKAFKKPQPVKIWWDAYLYKNDPGTGMDRQPKMSKYNYKLPNRIQAKGTYYINLYRNSSGKSVVTSKTKYGKGKNHVSAKRNRKKSRKIVRSTRKNKAIKKADWWSTYYNEVTIHCRVGKKSLLCKVSFVGGEIQKVECRNPEFKGTVFTMQARALGTFNHPITKMQLQKRVGENSEWEPVEGDTSGYRSFENGGDMNWTKWVTFSDYGTENDQGVRYRVAAYSEPGINVKYGYPKTEGKSLNEDGTPNTAFHSTPPALEGLTHRRIDDTKNVLFLTRDPKYIDNGAYKGFHLEVSHDDGGTWEEVPLSFLETNHALYNGEPVDWMDSKIRTPEIWHINTGPDQSFRYRIYPYTYNTDGETEQPSDVKAPSSEGTDVTYNTPAPPLNVTATLRSDGYVNLAITHTKTSTATLFYVERSSDGGDTWEYADAANGENGVEIRDIHIPELNYVDYTLVTGNDVRYRVSFANNKNFDMPTVGNGLSTPTESNTLSLLEKPNPPVLSIPFDGSSVTIDQSVIMLGWVHSPNDGTEQEQACVQYKVNSGDWITLVEETANYEDAYYNITNQSEKWSANDVITWRAKTKGAHAEFSDWSVEQTFKIYRKPSISVTAPSNMNIIRNLPIVLEWTYDDISGTLKSLILDILLDNDIVASFDLTNVESGEAFSDYIFENNETYTLRLTALSTTNLTSATSVSITIKYEKCIFKDMMQVSSNFDEDTGYNDVIFNLIDGLTQEDVDLLNAREDGDQPLTEEETYKLIDTSVKDVYVYRVYGDQRTFLVKYNVFDTDGTYLLGDDTTHIDKYAPINVDFYYELLMVGLDGSISTTTTVMRCASLWWYCYYGSDDIAKIRWNPTSTVSLDRPERQEVRYSGREYPVSYDSLSQSESTTFSCKVYGADYFMDEPGYNDDPWNTINAFRKMMAYGGRGVWKSFEGDVYPANFEFSYSSDYTDRIEEWTLNFTITRIDEGFDYDMEENIV